MVPSGPLCKGVGQSSGRFKKSGRFFFNGLDKLVIAWIAEYRDHLDVIRRHIDPIQNLHPVGRNGMHKYNNQDHSMLTSMMTVWNMLGAEHDIWEVNTDFEYHEEQRLERPETPRVEQKVAASGG